MEKVSWKRREPYEKGICLRFTKLSQEKHGVEMRHGALFLIRFLGEIDGFLQDAKQFRSRRFAGFIWRKRLILWRNETCYNVIRMTSEERFTRIENLLATMIEHHAGWEEEMRRHREESRQFELRHNKEIAEIREMQSVFAAGMLELKESHEKHEKEVAKIWEMSRVHEDLLRIGEERLNALIQTVDEIIRGRKN